MSPDGKMSGSPTAGEAVFDYFATDEIFQRVAASADEEFKHGMRTLFMSGLAAGLSIGLSFIARAALTANAPEPGAEIVGNLLYPIGFVLIVLGRYSLYTENTLTPVTLVMTRIASIPVLLRNWGVVLGANVIGAAIIAFVLATTGIFDAPTAEIARGFGMHGLEFSWSTLFFKGVVAGWIVASMVWLVHAARDSITRFVVVYFSMLLVPMADLFHCVVGAAEAFYLVFEGGATLFEAVFSFFMPVMLGNTLGGVLLVALLNYAQTRESRFPDRDCGELELTLREWLFGMYTGNPDPQVVENRHSTTDRVVHLAEGVSPEDHILGDTESPLTVVHYGDYECPTSRQIYTMTQDLQDETGVEFAYVYRHLAMTHLHPRAWPAAVASEAAALQGKFWPMHDILFDNQDELGHEELLYYADEIGLDVDQFAMDMERDTLHEGIDHDRKTALKSGVTATENLFLNGELYEGEFEIDTLRDVLEQALEDTKEG